MGRHTRFAALVVLLSSLPAARSSAQTPQLVFTAAIPDQPRADVAIQASAVVEERGLAMWGGTAPDFGVGTSVSTHGWTVRSVESLTILPIGAGGRPTFDQIDVVRPLFSRGSIAVAGGGGFRQEYDGSEVLIGRVLAGYRLGPGQLQGSLVMERIVSSAIRHDAADVVTSVGWARPIGRRVSVGIEGIGQDLEGLWNPAENDGGAKLLVGPSVHTQSINGRWTASLTAGPVVQTLSTVAPVAAPPPGTTAHHFGIFASATWVP
jgi:hypothetical protein